MGPVGAHTGVIPLVKFPELPKIILWSLGPNCVSSERIYSGGKENQIFLHFETIFLVLASSKVATSGKSLTALIWGYSATSVLAQLILAFPSILASQL